MGDRWGYGSPVVVTSSDLWSYGLPWPWYELTTITGTGAGVITSPQAAGAGQVIVSGVGAGAISPATVIASGQVIVSGAGAGVIDCQALGLGALIVSGLGAGVITSPWATGVAFVHGYATEMRTWFLHSESRTLTPEYQDRTLTITENRTFTVTGE